MTNLSLTPCLNLKILVLLTDIHTFFQSDSENLVIITCRVLCFFGKEERVDSSKEVYVRRIWVMLAFKPLIGVRIE